MSYKRWPQILPFAREPSPPGEGYADVLRAGTLLGRLWGLEAASRRLSERIHGWAHRDSNPEPRDYESLALTVELWARRLFIVRTPHERGNGERARLYAVR